MRSIGLLNSLFIFSLISLVLCSCAYTRVAFNTAYGPRDSFTDVPIDYSLRLPRNINTCEKTILVDPNVHAWGAYGTDGVLEKAGLATAGANWCPDIKRPCHTSAGTFRVFSLGTPSCKSHIFPKPRGGAPMPYCMYFNKGQALHGSSVREVVDGNISHGCVRMHVADAEWLRHNFVNVGTKVVVKPY